MRLSLFLVASAVASAGAFAPSASFVVPTRSSITTSTARFVMNKDQQQNEEMFSKNPKSIMPTKLASATTAAWLATTTIASAAGPDWGIFEGRTGSLLHPITMGAMFGLSLYTAFLGFQWRRQRTLGDEIAALKKQLPKKEDTPEGEAPPPPSPLEKQIDELTAERKELAAQGNRDKHYTQGAWIAFLGTLFAIEGPLNTYARAGKLFPGPHLYAGAGVVALWALAVFCVPSMTKGNDTARSIHIAANVSAISLFGWQVVSGIPILLKVVELTKWP